ncbi:MAG TPA: biotin--[acetyl-CoA-carboxylase] ligase [Tissierellia bacterium]|jgi:BirA family biotin operon repressor/biotin-[acetyl-CoA-carboxylase] ligase|nr:biotin--[acetyl-CoA-carboxylase] ligase [Tissierellia bacterium]
MYDLNKIREYLKTKIIGETIIQYEELDSTKAKAKSIFSTCPDGTLVLSENQSNCEVRFGKKWICLPGENIYLSIILKSFNNNLLPLIDVVGCSSIHKSVINLYGIDCKIKWPNDILINGNKVASVISEVARKEAGIILSLNINVNMEEQIEGLKTTSIKIEMGKQVEREKLIGTILNNIEYYYEELIETGRSDSFLDYYNNNLLLFNKEVEVIKRGRKTVRKVVAKNIDREGYLIVVNENGQEEILNPGEFIVQYEET